MGRAGPHFTTAIRGQPNSKAEPIRPFLASLTNFATGPLTAMMDRGRISPARGMAEPMLARREMRKQKGLAGWEDGKAQSGSNNALR